MKPLLNTLYVTVPDAYLRLEGETVCVGVEDEKKLQVPLHHIGGFVLFGHSMMSPALIGRCAEDGRSIVWLDRNGRFQSRVEGPVNGNVLLRQAQYRAADDEAICLDISRAIVAGKLRNSRHVVMRSARDSKIETEKQQLVHVAKQLGRIITKLPAANTLDQLRGYEGDAARIYFGNTSLLIKQQMRDDFQFTARSRRPPKDRFNALISFLYALLLNDCRSALQSVGLDPQLGYLHTVRPGRDALALDLMEEFRSIIADRLAFTLINRSQIKSSHFDERPGDAVLLNDDGRKLVITSYQERKQETLNHPLLEQTVSIGLLPHLQARILARVLRGDMDGYLPYLHR